MNKKFLLPFLFIFILSIVCFSASANTECIVGDCEVEIIINLAFIGANDSYIYDMADDIESVWNGPNGFQTTGDCKCKVTFSVKLKKVTDPNQKNCTHPQPVTDAHCIMVTDYTTDPPRNQSNITGAKLYMGYMYGVSENGGSLQGWWSDEMNRPVEGGNGERYHDAAHEAGHMMGLQDNEGDGLMSHTSGPNAKPTQENIDSAVKNVCKGKDYCPNRCCCGNGKVDKDKGEGCDPKATPTGCTSPESCCPYCCHCGKICDPKKGEYPSQEECKKNCKTQPGCMYNYETGCWDCLDEPFQATFTMYDSSTRPKGCPEPLEESKISQEELEDIKTMYNNNIGAAPVISKFFANERINLYIDGTGEVFFETVNGVVGVIHEGFEPDHTLNMFTDSETVDMILAGEMSVEQALDEGRITYDGEGAFKSVKFGFAKLMFWFYEIFAD
ncbi:hypothetical protein JW707_04790 [Candidatus Woesearchaeota archaeon]|nr:hypothetical protein [Candidatus Woesearchaeota archaeon]